MIENSTYLSGLTILYAEDEPDTQMELKKFLKRRAANVITASDGLEALEKAAQIHPDIVIADLIMPHMDGLEMIRLIRERDPICRIIITSTVSEMQTVLDSVDIGIVKYIIKPILLTDLEDALLRCAEELQQLRPAAPVPIHPEKRKLLEAQIKKEFSAIIKKYAGKGPRDIAVFIHSNHIDAVVYDAFTAFEHTLLKNRENCALVEQCRRSFYQIAEQDLLKVLSDLFSVKFQSDSAEINTYACSDKLCFTKE